MKASINIFLSPIIAVGFIFGTLKTAFTIGMKKSDDFIYWLGS